MLDWLKKQSVAAWITLVAAVIALVGFIIYAVNSTTGYMANVGVDGLVIAFSLLGVVALVAAFALGGKLDEKLIDLLIVAAAVFLCVGMGGFILGRVSQIADVYFIPTEAPADETATVTVAIAGVVFYVVSIVATAVAAFLPRKAND